MGAIRGVLGAAGVLMGGTKVLDAGRGAEVLAEGPGVLGTSSGAGGGAGY